MGLMAGAKLWPYEIFELFGAGMGDPNTPPNDLFDVLSLFK
jgi:hypothetical protein